MDNEGAAVNTATTTGQTANVSDQLPIKEHHLHLAARFFDFIFVGGFIFLFVMFIIQCSTHNYWQPGATLTILVILGYYAFFIGFMILAIIEHDLVM